MFPYLNFPDGFTFSLIGQVHKKQLIPTTFSEHLGWQLGYVIGSSDHEYRCVFLLHPAQKRTKNPA